MVVSFLGLATYRIPNSPFFTQHSAYHLAFGITQFSFISKDATLIIPLRIGLIVIYILIAISLSITIILVRKVMSVAATSSPKPTDLLGLRDWNRLRVKQQYAASLLVAYEYNTSTINNKVTYFMGAEKWFTHTIFLLLVLLISVGLAFTLPYGQVGMNNNSSNSQTLLKPTAILSTPQSLTTTTVISSPMASITGTKAISPPRIVVTNVITINP